MFLKDIIQFRFDDPPSICAGCIFSFAPPPVLAVFLSGCIWGLPVEADPSADWEPEGSVPSQPRARSADVLTSAAIPGRVAALDVGGTSPAATNGEGAPSFPG